MMTSILPENAHQPTFNLGPLRIQKVVKIFCSEEVWAACSECLTDRCFLCFDHFNMRDHCSCHNVAFVANNVTAEDFNDVTELVSVSFPDQDVRVPSTICTASEVEELENGYDKANQDKVSEKESQNGDHSATDEFNEEIPNRTAARPEDFRVDGEPLTATPEKQDQREIKSRNFTVKLKRNSGDAYLSEKSRKLMPSRKDASYNSPCPRCPARNFSCKLYAQEEREDIRQSYYDLSNLQRQRQWIAHHVTVEPQEQMRKKYTYTLPSTSDPLQKSPVCQKIYISTLGISARQVKTAMEKMKPCGIMEGECRGGRQTQ